ncbi:hypothetical protein BC829DRAFT_413209 [Chytridium lagenaria]|nr:hypothetical protein BC829DRAFT_413209 [Chytridium lagenaria]
MSPSSSPSHPSHPKSTYRLLTLANKQEYYPEWKLLILNRIDGMSLPTKYYAMSVLKMSDQLRHEVVAPQVPAEVVANGAVVNEAVRIAAIEKARQWNEVESTINNVLTEHMDSTMRLKFNSSTAYTSIYRRFRAFELSLHHDSGHTVDSIQGELKRIVQGSRTP